MIMTEVVLLQQHSDNGTAYLLYYNIETRCDGDNAEILYFSNKTKFEIQSLTNVQ